MYQSHTSRLTELWSLPRPNQGLNTNNNKNNICILSLSLSIYIYIYNLLWKSVKRFEQNIHKHRQHCNFARMPVIFFLQKKESGQPLCLFFIFSSLKSLLNSAPFRITDSNILGKQINIPLQQTAALVHFKLHGYPVHQQYWTLFYYQLMHITLKNAELLKHSKLDKNAPTCFGLHRNHLQGAKFSEDGFYVNRNMLERFYLS